MKIKAVIWQEDDLWCGSVPALPGCHTWGESYKHLLEMLEDTVQGWLEVAYEREEADEVDSYENVSCDSTSITVKEVKSQNIAHEEYTFVNLAHSARIFKVMTLDQDRYCSNNPLN